MKKINKLLSLFLVLALLVPLLNVSSVEANPLAEYQFPVLTGPDYFNIENNADAPQVVLKTPLTLLNGLMKTVTKSTNQQPSRLYPQETTPQEIYHGRQPE